MAPLPIRERERETKLFEWNCATSHRTCVLSLSKSFLLGIWKIIPSESTIRKRERGKEVRTTALSCTSRVVRDGPYKASLLPQCVSALPKLLIWFSVFCLLLSLLYRSYRGSAGKARRPCHATTSRWWTPWPRPKPSSANSSDSSTWLRYFTIFSSPYSSMLAVCTIMNVFSRTRLARKIRVKGNRPKPHWTRQIFTSSIERLKHFMIKKNQYITFPLFVCKFSRPHV